MRDREVIMQEMLVLFRQLASDWQYSGTIGRETRLLADLGFESLDVVILSTEVQEFYGQTLPYADFFEIIGTRAVRDVTVGEWVDFIYENLAPAHA